MVTTRATKGLPLTWAEVDQNFNGLESSITAAIDAMATGLDAKAGLDAYDRANHTGTDGPVLNEQLGTSYTLTVADGLPSTTLRMNNAAANTVTLPTYASVALPIGFRIPVDQWGVGATTIVPSAGVTLRSASSTQIRAQYSRVWIEKQGTNEWLLTGDLSAGGSLGTAPFCSVAPSIAGTPVAGQTLTATPGTWTGSPSPTVTGQWYKNGVAIVGETAATYASATPGDAGGSITYTESAVNTAGGPTTATSNAIILASAAASKPVYSVLPVITGNATVGSTLTASCGTWSNSPTTYKYQWYSNGTTLLEDTGQIAGTTDTYLLTQNEAGTTITVVVTAHNASGDTDNPATSLGTPISGALAELTESSFPAIYAASGVYEAGTALTVDVGSWLNNPTFSYQWYRATSTSDTLTAIGTNSASYTTTNDDAEKTISCAVTGTTTAGPTTVYALGVYIDAASGAPVNSVAPVVSGLTPIGSTLSCTTGTWTNTPTYAYQWKRGATNIGTDSSTYDTVAADGGSAITCVVTATANSLSASATSSNSITVDSAGSGSLAIAQSTVFTPSVSSAEVDWAIWNNCTVTPNERKNGGGSLIGASNQGGSTGSGWAGPADAVAWSGGTPDATGSATGTCQCTWGIAGGGFDVTFPVGTSETVCDVYIHGYNQIFDVTASLSDSSAADVSTSLDSGTGASTNMTRFRVTATAAASSQTLTVAIRTRSPEPYGDGNFHLRCAAIIS